MGYKSSFTVLGKSALIKKKKQVAEEAPEDWEKEVEGWDAG
jgi:transcriptional repressor NF-X1